MAAYGEHVMNQAFIHNAILGVMPQALATGLFISLCTIQAPNGLANPDGSPQTDGNGNPIFVNVAGLVNIPCTAPPITDNSIQATEVKALAEILSEEILHVLLNSWYPQLQGGVTEGWQAVVDGTVYDLMGAESDSQEQMTRLKVRLAKV
jgi:hypothetical protein